MGTASVKSKAQYLDEVHMWLCAYTCNVLTTLTLAPIARGGRLCRNFALTTPLLPWGRVTLPQMMRFFFGLISPRAINK